MSEQPNTRPTLKDFSLGTAPPDHPAYQNPVVVSVSKPSQLGHPEEPLEEPQEAPFDWNPPPRDSPQWAEWYHDRQDEGRIRAMQELKEELRAQGKLPSQQGPQAPPPPSVPSSSEPPLPEEPPIR